ncbi:putative short-chain dehydrogenase/reductase family protein [Daldinia caldariorum]|uniref:putative short-chain dehydrogenase/reductase family protein n=1 Tax=Daldinia caldariorum TaxID=326644 RepID=UPI0020077B59|nr:putative short-chain dehydrogenase/reductase family protein [Daldinia caldariorum]KAI1470386.1 putative short-chain dehydrogenase/reductase family protein [Daldinia caldariorum]
MSSELESQAAFEATLIGFLYRQYTQPRPVPADTRVTDQVAIVTGSNIGIGFEACRQYLRLGISHLIMAVRSQAKGDEAAHKLRKEFPGSNVSVWTVEMESYDSIRAFVDRCAALPRIDMVILNAALMRMAYTTVPATGHELTMQVNYLSTALLAILLLPILKSKKIDGAKRPPVLSIVGSDLAYRTEMETKGPILQQFDKSEGFGELLWYGRSKLLLTFFVAKLAEFVDADDVLINMPNPGTIKGTGFFRDFPTLAGKLVAFLHFLFGRRVDVGATTYLDATVVRGKEGHGSFISDWAIKPYPLIWYGAEGKVLNERLWEETMQELNFVGASKILEDLKTRH